MKVSSLKSVFIALIGLVFLISCGKDDTPQDVIVMDDTPFILTMAHFLNQHYLPTTHSPFKV